MKNTAVGKDDTVEWYVINGEVVDFFIAIPPLRIFVKEYTGYGWGDELVMFFVDKDDKVIDKITIEAEGYATISYRQEKGDR